MNMIESLTASIWFDAISMAIAIISLILAFVFYYRSKNEKNPCYSKAGKHLIDREVIANTAIEVMFQGSHIGNLTSTKLALWNNGRATITQDDIANSDPLRLVTSNGARILAVDLIAGNEPANSFEVDLQSEGDLAFINFDFIDYKQGAVFNVYHTGTSMQDIDIVGTIIGAGSLINVYKAGELLMNIFDKVHYSLFEAFSHITPRWLHRLIERVESSQNLLLHLLLFFPLTVIFAPILILYIIIGTIFILVLMGYLFFVTWRYKLPRGLYSIMKSV
jgi:hypothetical protein